MFNEKKSSSLNQSKNKKLNLLQHFPCIFLPFASRTSNGKLHSTFYYEFLSGTKVLFSVMNYVQDLLRKHHFLLQLWVLPDDLKAFVSSTFLSDFKRTIFSLTCLLVSFKADKVFLSFKFALFLDRSINHG